MLVKQSKSRPFGPTDLTKMGAVLIRLNFPRLKKTHNAATLPSTGLYQDPLTREIIDHVGGRADLDAKILRAIGNPEDRFKEDALRLLRAIRFATTTGFEIEPQTWIAIQECAPLLSQISPERIRDEFSRIIIAPDRGRGLDLLVESGLIMEFLPEVTDLQGCEQPPQWHP
jgi:poly(A) polymerase